MKPATWEMPLTGLEFFGNATIFYGIYVERVLPGVTIKDAINRWCRGWMIPAGAFPYRGKQRISYSDMLQADDVITLRIR